MPSPEENEIRIEKLEGDMSQHDHSGRVSAKVNLLKASAVGDILAGGASGDYEDLNAGDNGDILTPDSSLEKGLKWAKPFDGPMTMLQQADHGLNNLVVSRIRGLYPGISLDDTSRLDRLEMFAAETITADYGQILLPGSSGSSGDDSQIKGFVQNDLGSPALDINGPAEMTCNLKTVIIGSGNINKTLFVGWAVVNELPLSDDTTYVKKHIGFWAVATDIDGDYSLKASVGDGTTQTLSAEIDDNFDITNSYRNFRVHVVSSTEVNYYIDGLLVATITSGLPSSDDDNYLPAIQATNGSGTTAYQILYAQLNGYFVNSINV